MTSFPESKKLKKVLSSIVLPVTLFSFELENVRTCGRLHVRVLINLWGRQA